MPAPRRTFAAVTLGLELDGVHVAWLSRAIGGEATGEVIVAPPTSADAQSKHLGAVRYEDIVVTCCAGIGAPLWDALQGVFKGDRAQHSGAVVAHGLDRGDSERLEFFDALVSAVEFPQLDGSSKDVARVRVTFAPAQTRRRAGATPVASRVSRNSPSSLQSNFRVAIDGLDAAASKVSKVGALAVKQAPGGLEVSNLVLTVPRSAAKLLESWHDEFVVNGAGTERTGTIELLAPNFKDVLLRMELGGLGIFRLAYDALESGTEQTPTATAFIYCERLVVARSPAPI